MNAKVASVTPAELMKAPLGPSFWRSLEMSRPLMSSLLLWSWLAFAYVGVKYFLGVKTQRYLEKVIVYDSHITWSQNTDYSLYCAIIISKKWNQDFWLSIYLTYWNLNISSVFLNYPWLHSVVVYAFTLLVKDSWGFY